MKYKALIIDFDGTTIKNGQHTRPTPAVIAAIQEAKKRLFVSGATGRVYTTAKWIFDDLQLISPSIVSAGTKIVNPRTGELLWQVRMSKATVEQVLSTAKQFPFTTITESQLVIFPPKKRQSIQEEGVIYITEVPVQESQSIIEALRKIPLTALHTTMGYKANTLDIHITHETGSKEHAVNKLRIMLGVKKEEIIGVGDNYNDLALFDAVGFKIAMGNAAPELQAKADFVTNHVDDDGLVDVIEKFILSS